jgi:16S rRNA (guanine(527)-N(7))-methyltransferase RsmG
VFLCVLCGEKRVAAPTNPHQVYNLKFMDGARIAKLLHPFLGDADPLAADDLDYISTYIDILLRWNARMNLTAIRNPEEIVTRHFGESFFAARHLFPKPRPDSPQTDEEHGSTLRQQADRTAHPDGGDRERAPSEHDDLTPQAEHHDRGRAALQGRVTSSEEFGALAPVRGTHANPAAEQRNKITLADVGSGAGFPGIPIKLWAPEIHLTLIESNQKKATFLKEVTRALTLTDIDIKNTRAELFHSRFDTVTLRAVERFETILPIAANLVSPCGRLALLIGSTQLRNPDTRLPNFEPGAPISIPHSKSRTLQIYQRKS